MEMCESSITAFNRKDSESVSLFRQHGVLPSNVNCEKCGYQCNYRSDVHGWRCQKTYVLAKTKKRRVCGYSISDYSGTFLQNTHLKPWQVLLFINHFLHHNWDHKTVVENIQISRPTSVDWRSFCSEVTDYWFEEQCTTIGGPGIEVEIDETTWFSCIKTII